MKGYLLRILTLCFFTVSSLQLLRAQSVEYDPGRNPFYNYTVVAFNITAPPVIDGIIDDLCWTKPASGPESSSGGAGFDGTKFPDNQNIRLPINVSDHGTLSPNPPPPNSYTGAYPTSTGTFGICWDLNFLYFAVKITNQAAADLTTETNDRGIQLYLNNGNGRSGIGIPIDQNFPRNLSDSKDMQLQLWYLPAPGVTAFPILGTTSGVANGGIALQSNEYKFAVKKTQDGYIYEGRIAWNAINREFINVGTGEYVDNKWRPAKGRLLGIDIGASLLRGASGSQQMEMNWNECCLDINWDRSAYYGYLHLAGDTGGIICPTSFVVTLSSPIISVPNQKVTAGATSFLPLDAIRDINWTILGTNGIYPMAFVDKYSGVITPLSNGVVTVIGTSNVRVCSAGTVSGMAVLTISSQIAPTQINISGNDITQSWGTSNLTASVLPASAPDNIVWSIEPASSLAMINSITGVLSANGSNDGLVTVKATSIVNGVSGIRVVSITGQPNIYQLIIKSNSNGIQCKRPSNSQFTISGFNVGDTVNLYTEYQEGWGEDVGPGFGVGTVPSNLIKYTIQQLVPAAAIFNGKLVLNQLQGNFSITGTYLSDTTKKTTVKVTLKGASTSPCSVPGSVLGIGDLEISRTELIIYPNPSNGSFTVDNTGAETLNYKIINSIGIVVGEGKLNVGKNTLALNLAKGVYLLLTEAESKKISIE